MKPEKPSKPDISQTLQKDRFKLNREWQKLQAVRKNDQIEEESRQYQQQKQAFDKRINESKALFDMRHEKQLDINYPEQLPVSERRQEIADVIDKHQVVIVAGETGSGKTTQLPKICLELGRGRSAMIGHTQPRRVAASSVANRIADELHVELGQEVGYQVRFTDSSNEHTLLKLMTDGVLLAEIPHDRFLEKYDTIIIDEAHERSLNIDFLLGYIKQLLPRRRDLKVIITSATIDVERFSKHFNDAPIIKVSGRSYPVEMRYRAVEELGEEKGDDLNLSEAILHTLKEIDDLERQSPDKNLLGDVLVFLPGEYDIRQTSLLLRREQLPSTEVLPLYARLSAAEHRKIFQLETKKAGRRVVLATNVAETSLTVPGIRYVIDCGLARMSRYSHRSKIQRLPIEKISQASANQRAGRCGRLSAGVCYRLYSEEDFKLREEFTQPEIQRTNLSAVILQMQMMRLGDIDDFPFLEPPDSRLINDGFKQLMELAALNEKRQITPLGKQLGMLPIDPRFARIVVQAHQERCLKEVLIIISALSIQDPRENPADKREAAREKHSRFKDDSSDFMSLYNLWVYVEEQRQELSNNQFKKQCQKEFLSSQRLREWRETHRQLHRICQRLKLTENKQDADYNSIHRSLLSGLLLNIGFQSEPKMFDGTRNRQFRIFPASWLFKKPPKWIMAGELIETKQLYAHHVAKIDPVWLRDVAKHLLKYSYTEPHWSAKQGQVMAYERSSLYGLVVSDKRQVSYGKIDPGVSREVFIRVALVEEQMRSNAPFFKHNAQLKKQLLDIEEKSRRRDLIVNDEAVFEFYDQLIPDYIVNLAGFEKWRKKAEKETPKLLFANKSIFQAAELGDYSREQFPNRIDWGGVDYALKYRFEPGHAEDGISLRLPVAALNRVPRFLFDWLVPGLLMEKCGALIKSLPKQYRRPLVPVPETVKLLVPQLKMADQSLELALAEIIAKEFGVKIPADAWQAEKLDDYYKMNFQLFDEHGTIIEQSRDLSQLIKKHGHKVQQVLDKRVSRSTEKQVYTHWTFGDIKQQDSFKQSGSLVQSYPAVLDEGDKVSITLTDYAHVQTLVHRKGLIRLAMLALPQQVKYLRKELLRGNDLQLKLSAEYDKDELLNDVIAATFNHTFFADELPFTQKSFEQLIESNRSNMTAKAQELEKLLRSIINDDYDIRQHLAQLNEKNMGDVKADIEAQRSALVYPGFLYQTPANHLYELPRYFRALSIRLERLQGQLAKDKKHTAELAELLACIDELIEESPEAADLPSLIEYRWMIEEYRVSLFSQQLKTKRPISKKRLEKQWQNVLEERRSNIL